MITLTGFTVDKPRNLHYGTPKSQDCKHKKRICPNVNIEVLVDSLYFLHGGHLGATHEGGGRVGIGIKRVAPGLIVVFMGEHSLSEVDTGSDEVIVRQATAIMPWQHNASIKEVATFIHPQ